MVEAAGDVHPVAATVAYRLQGALTLAEVEDAYLDSARLAVPACGVGMYRLDPKTFATTAVAADVDAAFLEAYEAWGRHDDPVLRHVRQSRTAVDSSRAASSQEWLRSGAGAVLRSWGFAHSLEAPIVINGELVGTVNFARRDDEPPFGVRDLGAAGVVGQQLALAVERATRFELLSNRGRVLEAALDGMRQPLVVTVAGRSGVIANRAARAVRRGKPSLAEVAQPAIQEAVALFRRDARATITTGYGAPGSGIIVKSTRLGDAGAVLSLIHQQVTDEPAVLPKWGLLSVREQEIAEMVSRGLSTRDIAARAFVTENTVKQHLKRIFAKVDVHSRAELVQRVWQARSPADDTDELRA